MSRHTRYVPDIQVPSLDEVINQANQCLQDPRYSICKDRFYWEIVKQEYLTAANINLSTSDIQRLIHQYYSEDITDDVLAEAAALGLEKFLRINRDVILPYWEARQHVLQGAIQSNRSDIIDDYLQSMDLHEFIRNILDAGQVELFARYFPLITDFRDVQVLALKALANDNLDLIRIMLTDVEQRFPRHQVLELRSDIVSALKSIGKSALSQELEPYLQDEVQSEDYSGIDWME